ncbi:MAG TPA: hypothetical protein VOB72_02740 [Candidatus Dormibacteraeota bacterium]|nr:hypothetical protein [Candidatus Dormibacteraeota bacterium]
MTITEIDARKLIDELDLAYPIEEARGELGDRVEAAAQCYRDFLYVCWVARQKGVRVAAICECADAIWHEHILVTPKYRDDCDIIFGGFLDHIPADWLGDEPSPDDRAATEAIYQAAGVTPCATQRARCVWPGP